MIDSIFRGFFTEHDGGNVRKPVIDTSPDACIDQLANGVADALVMASNRSVGQTIGSGRLEDAGRKRARRLVTIEVLKHIGSSLRATRMARWINGVGRRFQERQPIWIGRRCRVSVCTGLDRGD